MKNVSRKVFLFFLVWMLFLVPVLAEGEDNGQEAGNENTVTIQMVEDELERISKESANKDELFSKCMASTLLTDDMKAVYCKQPASNNNQLFDIVLDYNEDVRAGERTKRFYTTLWNSTQTANYIGWDLFDWGSSIVTVVSGMILNLIETIGGIITVVVLFIVNISTTGVVAEILRDLFNQLYTFLFGGYENALILIALIYLIGLARIFIERPENLRNMQVILGVLKQSTLAFLFLLAIAIPGKEVFYTIDQWVDKGVVEISNRYFSESDEFKGDTSGTILKTKIFYTMAEQPFMIRHYGVLSEDAIASKFGVDSNQATARYEKLLYDPSRANAKNEMKNLGNKVIPHDMLTMAIAMLSSLFMLLHKILIGIVFTGFSLLLLFSSTFKEVLLGLSFVALFSFALSRDTSAGRIIGNRLTWIFALGMLPFFVNLALELVIKMITTFGNINFMFIFVADLILVASVWIAWANKEKIIQTLTRLKDPITGMMNGTYSLAQGFSDFNEMVNPRDESSSYKSSSSGSAGGGNATINTTLDKINQNDLAEEKAVKEQIDDHDSLAEVGEAPELEELSPKVSETTVKETIPTENEIKEAKTGAETTSVNESHGSVEVTSKTEELSSNELKASENASDSEKIELAEEDTKTMKIADNREVLNGILQQGVNPSEGGESLMESSNEEPSSSSNGLLDEEKTDKVEKNDNPDDLADFLRDLESDDFLLTNQNNGYRNTSDEDLFDVSKVKSIDDES